MPEQVTVEDFLKSLCIEKDALYIFQPCSIGDVIYSAGLSHAVQNRKNKSRTIMVVAERMKNLGMNWDNIAGFIYLPFQTINAIRWYFVAINKYEGDNWIHGHYKIDADKKFITDNTLNAIDSYRKVIFNLPLDTPFIPPKLAPISDENIAELRAKYLIDKARTVILLPYANSIKNLNPRFWEIMAAQLKARNYIVYTNVDGIREQPVAGTAPIVTNFSELNYLADKVKCFIGLRSGVFDFLALTRARTFVISNFPDWGADLNILHPECNNRNFYSAVEYMQSIIEHIPHDFGVHFEIRLSHQYINQQDIYFSYENILTGILNAVDSME